MLPVVHLLSLLPTSSDRDFDSAASRTSPMAASRASSFTVSDCDGVPALRTLRALPLSRFPGLCRAGRSLSFLVARVSRGTTTFAAFGRWFVADVALPFDELFCCEGAERGCRARKIASYAFHYEFDVKKRLDALAQATNGGAELSGINGTVAKLGVPRHRTIEASESVVKLIEFSERCLG
eukprot:347698-Pleurochrysis_carterae.AAC.2